MEVTSLRLRYSDQATETVADGKKQVAPPPERPPVPAKPPARAGHKTTRRGVAFERSWPYCSLRCGSYGASWLMLRLGLHLLPSF
jgi:hypothetical protein